MGKIRLKNIIGNKRPLNEFQIDDIQDVSISPVIKRRIDQFIQSIEGKKLTKVKIAAILNTVIEGLGLNKSQITIYMNMIKRQQTSNTKQK
jgi:hypothetical protein